MFYAHCLVTLGLTIHQSTPTVPQAYEHTLWFIDSFVTLGLTNTPVHSDCNLHHQVWQINETDFAARLSLYNNLQLLICEDVFSALFDEQSGVVN